MIESRACPECGAEVPAGRLSCGSCGALLASVDRHGVADRAPVRVTPSGRDAADPTGLPEESASAEPVQSGDAAAVESQPDLSFEAPIAEATPGALPEAQPPPLAAPEVIELPRPPMPPIPGAYLAPSAVMRSAPITATQPVPAALSAQPAPASASGSPPRGLEPLSPIEPTLASPARVPVLELPFAIAPGIGPRLVAGGAALAAVAFVLPWVSGGGVVIGGAFGSGYFATWGLAAVGNVLPFLLAWVSLVLAVLPNRVPRFAALGVLPLLLGGIFAGLGWTYLIGPLGTGIGIWALAVGAVLLTAGGTLVLRGEGPAR